MLVLALAVSCGIVGVCEQEPDLGGGAAPRLAHGPSAPGREDHGDVVASWQGPDVGGDGGLAEGGEARLLSTGLVPGVSAYEKMNVFARPDYNSARIGYLRRGIRVLVRGPVDSPPCGDNGQLWFQLEEGGYVCAGKGLLIGAPLSAFLYVPPAPDFDKPVPYRYARVRRNRTPVYKRLPTREEIQEAHDFLFPPPPDAGLDGGVDGGGVADEDAGLVAPPPVVDDLGDLGEGVPPPVPLEAATLPVEGPDAGAADAAEPEDAGFSDADRELLQRGPRHRLLSRVLMSGFTVAVTGMERFEGRTWYRTIEGGFIDDDALGMIDIRDERIGRLLDATTTLPVGIVTGRSARVFARNERDEIVPETTLGKFDSFAITGEEVRGERKFWATTDGKYVSHQRGIVVVEKLDPPRAVGQWDKWIVVDLTLQTLTAYEGPVPVFVTLVSSGKEGFETPRGVFRILAKHVSNPMDDFALGEPYAIDEVPYVMYFQQNVALHGAFWHRGFGAVRSHGCVNLAPHDAHWLFDWVHPFRPEGWYGVYATDTDPGTIVWVRKSEPRD
jgi:hypothetical protein